MKRKDGWQEGKNKSRKGYDLYSKHRQGRDITRQAFAEWIDPDAQLSQINTCLNIVHTKQWLLNEIPVTPFHLTSLVKVLMMFHFSPISAMATPES